MPSDADKRSPSGKASAARTSRHRKKSCRRNGKDAQCARNESAAAATNMNGFWERESKLRARDHARDSIRERKQSVHTLLPVDEVSFENAPNSEGTLRNSGLDLT